MKKITFLATFLMILFGAGLGFAQTPKVVVIGANHDSAGANNDGIAFVVTDALAANEVVYFTEMSTIIPPIYSIQGKR